MWLLRFEFSPLPLSHLHLNLLSGKHPRTSFTRNPQIKGVVLCATSRDSCVFIESSSTNESFNWNLRPKLGACRILWYRGWLWPVLGKFHLCETTLIPLIVTAALDSTGLAEGAQVVIVLPVLRPADLSPQDTVLHTPASNDLEY